MNSENFQNKYKVIFKQNLCDYLDGAIDNSEAYCNQFQVINKSLYTVSVYILETLRKYAYLRLEEPEEYLDVLDSQEFQDLGKDIDANPFKEKIEEIELLGYKALMDELEATIIKSFSYISTIGLSYLLFWYVVLFLCYFVFDWLIVSRIKYYIFEVRKILMMIPVTVINSDEDVMQLFLKDHEKYGVRNRRKRMGFNY